MKHLCCDILHKNPQMHICLSSFFTIAKDFLDPLKLNNNEILIYCMSNPICVWTLLFLISCSYVALSIWHDRSSL